MTENTTHITGVDTRTNESEATATDRQDPPAQEGTEALRERIVETLKTVYDPEIPVDIFEMGLVYRIEIESSRSAPPPGAEAPASHPVHIVMTLTSPMCPVAETLPPEVEEKVRHVEGVSEVRLDLVWEPEWTPDMMSEAAKLALNM